MAVLTLVTDTFTRANETPLASPWATTNSTLNLVSNRVRASANDGGQKVMRYGAFNVSMMRSTVTLAAYDGNQAGCGVRCSSTAMTLYTAVLAGGTVYLEKIVAGGFTQLGPSYDPAETAGDTIGCYASDSDIAAYYDGSVVIGPISDSAIDSGTWAIRMSTTGTLANLEIDDAVLETFEPIFLGAGAKGEIASGNVTLGEPAYATGFTKAVDDVWIAAIHSTDQVAHSFTDWTQIVQGNGGSTISRLSVWYHRYAGSNPNFVVTHTAGGPILGGIVAFRNCLATGSPVDVSSAIAAGTVANIAHTAVTPTVDETKLLAINGAGDDNARTLLTGYTSLLEDVLAATQNAYVTTLGVDGSVSIFQKNSNIAQSVSSGTVTVVQAAADAWAATLIALEVATAAATPIEVDDLASDALGSYADAMTIERRGPPRWNDSIAFTKADVGTSPIDKVFPADALGSYADAPTLRLSFFTAPAADSMTMADQAATVTRALIVSLSDALGGYADQLTISFRLSVTPSDSLGQYSDQAPTISYTAALSVTSAADSLPAYVDSSTGLFTLAARPSDDLNQWADQRTVFLSGSAALTPELSDNLASYTDTPTISMTAAYGIGAADSLQNWLDNLTAIFAERVIPPGADAMAQLDQLAVIVGRLASFAADAMAQTDQLASIRGHLVALSDALPAYADQLSISTLTAKTAGFSDALGSYSDALGVTRTISVSRTDGLANWADQLDITKVASGVPRVGWTDEVAATTAPVRIGWNDSVTVVRSLATERSVNLTSIKPIQLDSFNLQVGLNHGHVIYLLDGLGNYIIDENGNRVIISGLIDNLLQSDSVAITRSAGGITPWLVPLSDALSPPTDAVQIIRGIVTLTPTLSDALPAYSDAPEIQYVGVLSVSLSDNLGGYNDSIPGVSTSGEKRIAQTDALANYVDSSQVSYIGNLEIFRIDALPVCSDEAASNTSGGLFAPLADTLPAHGDSVQSQYTGALTVALTDALGILADSVDRSLGGNLRATLSDNLAAYGDTPALRRGLLYPAPIDNLANYLDVATSGGTGQKQAALSDNLSQYTDFPTTFANLKAQLADNIIFSDSVTGLFALNYERADDLFLGVRFADLIDFRLGSIEEIRVEFSDDLDEWADRSILSTVFFAIRLSGNVAERIALTGKVIEEQVSLNGQVHDKADITGELYIGEP